MKHDKLPHARLARHEASLARGQMIPIAGLVRIPMEIRRLAVEDVRAAGQRHLPRLVLLVIARVNHIGDPLTARDRHEAFLQLAQPEPPLLLISSDMNHFASDEATRRLDEMALTCMDRLDPDGLYETCRANHISMCGMVPAVIVMETLRILGKLKRAERAGYSTTADTTGDPGRVVGYAGMMLG